MTAIVTTGDARDLPFPDESIDLIVTSPPYFGLRKYAPADGARPAIGEEPGPREFIASLVECTREMARVLKPSGSIFVNLGDKYGRPGGGVDRAARTLGEVGRGATARQPSRGGQDKSLMLLPERFRIACTDELGLIARAVLIWSKPNGLPESVRDRVRRSHEDWVHLTKSPRYFEAVDEIREPHAAQQTGAAGTFARKRSSHDLVPGQTARQHRAERPDVPAYSALGKLPGSVWTIATQPLRVPAELEVDHFAAFPMEWPRRLVTGWCPREVCSSCGQGRRPVATAQRTRGGQPVDGAIYPTGAGRLEHASGRTHDERTVRELVGYACACPDTSAPSTPGVVLDPFGGTGTTALVAAVLGRVGISLDASVDYGRIAAWRTTDERERAAAAGNDRGAVVAPTPAAPGLFAVGALP